MSDAEAIVDWGLAERTATALIAGVPGTVRARSRADAPLRGSRGGVRL